MSSNNGYGFTRGSGRLPAGTAIPANKKDSPFQSIQCFEQRHQDCKGSDTMMSGKKCECACHEGASHE